METKTKLAPPELQEKEKDSPNFTRSLKGILAPKNEIMQCVSIHEAHLDGNRLLKVEKGVVVDVTDPENPRNVSSEEEYYIGWL